MKYNNTITLNHNHNKDTLSPRVITKVTWCTVCYVSIYFWRTKHYSLIDVTTVSFPLLQVLQLKSTRVNSQCRLRNQLWRLWMAMTAVSDMEVLVQKVCIHTPSPICYITLLPFYRCLFISIYLVINLLFIIVHYNYLLSPIYLYLLI